MNTKNDEPEYLTIVQAGRFLQVSLNTLRNWDKNGTLKAIRIGGRNIRRWKKDDVLKFLESGKQ